MQQRVSLLLHAALSGERAMSCSLVSVPPAMFKDRNQDGRPVSPCGEWGVSMQPAILFFPKLGIALWS